MLLIGTGGLVTSGAGCLDYGSSGGDDDGDGNETPDNETDENGTIPDVPPEEDEELELVFEDWFEENTVDAGVWETEFPWGERIHNFNAYASPNNTYVYDDALVLKAEEEEHDIGDLDESDQERDVDGPEEEEEDEDENGDGDENGDEDENGDGDENGDDDGNGDGDEDSDGNGENDIDDAEDENEEDDGGDDEASDIVPYTTGVATPYRSFSPGYIEGRIRIPPTVDGFWPAFWLTPDDEWPPEIDIFEFFGSDPCAYMTYYYRDSDGDIEDDEGTHCGPDFSADFHEFAVDWREDRIVWYIDGEEQFRFEEEDYISTTEMRLILNFGVDASFVGEPDSDDLPAYMEIDWVRVWER